MKNREAILYLFLSSVSEKRFSSMHEPVIFNMGHLYKGYNGRNGYEQLGGLNS